MLSSQSAVFWVQLQSQLDFFWLQNSHLFPLFNILASSRDGIALTFGDDGLLATPCTMVIYMEGHPQSARKLILSAGGRCRVERSVK